MTAATLVATLRERGVALLPDGDQIVVRPASRAADLLDDLRQHKAEVLALLTAPASSTLPAWSYAPPWPDSLPGLGPRRVIAFDVCADCPPDGVQSVRIGGLTVQAPADRGTWIAYGDRPLCLTCARVRRRPPSEAGV
jgi:hypothetical protein